MGRSWSSIRMAVSTSPGSSALSPKLRISVLWLTAALFHQVVDEDLAAIARVKKFWRAAMSSRLPMSAGSSGRRTAVA